MSRRTTSNQFNTSFTPSSSTQTSPTVLRAIRKLKEESQLLLREHKRYRVLNHQISRENIKQVDNNFLVTDKIGERELLSSEASKPQAFKLLNFQSFPPPNPWRFKKGTPNTLRMLDRCNGDDHYSSACRRRTSILRPKAQSSSQLIVDERKLMISYHIKQVNQSKKERFFCAVKQSVQDDKEVKKDNERKKIEEVKKRFSVNLRQREQNRQMIQNVRKSFNNANHELYEQIRQKRKQNENAVHSKRADVLQSRVMGRRQADQQTQMRRQSIQHFHHSRVDSYKRSKQAQIDDLLRKSEQKRKFCQALSSRNSRVRENKLQLSRSVSNRSMRNPESKSLQH